VKAKLASLSPADVLLQPIFNPVGGYASYVVPAAFVLILQQTLLIGAAMLTGTALAKGGGVFAGVLGRGIAHLTIYLPALALYLIVLPRIYGFSTLATFHNCSRSLRSFCLRPASWGRPSGPGSRAGKRDHLLLATSLPQFSWPDSHGRAKQFPTRPLRSVGFSPPTPRSMASCASTSSAPASGRSRMIGSDCGVWRSPISRSP